MTIIYSCRDLVSCPAPFMHACMKGAGHETSRAHSAKLHGRGVVTAIPISREELLARPWLFRVLVIMAASFLGLPRLCWINWMNFSFTANQKK